MQLKYDYGHGLEQFLISLFQSTAELQQKLNSYQMTCFRIGVGASRIAEVLNSRLDNGQKSSCMFMIETGQQATISGEGYLLEDFLKSGKIENFSGLGTKLKRIHERDFKDAAYRLVKSDETFYHLNYDSCSSILYFSIFFIHPNISRVFLKIHVGY